MKPKTFNPYEGAYRLGDKWTISDNPLFGERHSEFLNLVDGFVDRVSLKWEGRVMLDDEVGNPLGSWPSRQHLIESPLILVIRGNYLRLKPVVCSKLDKFSQLLMNDREEDEFGYEASQLEYFSSLLIHCLEIPYLTVIRNFNVAPLSAWSEEFLLRTHIAADGEILFGYGLAMARTKRAALPAYRSICSTPSGVKLNIVMDGAEIYRLSGRP